MIDKFLDVDFTKDPRYVFGYTGPGDTSRFSSYGDNFPLYDEGDWLELADQIGDMGLDSLVTRIYDQKQEGSCVANATSQAIEVCQAEQFGKDRVVHLSAISLYKRIGRSPSSGANVGDAWDEINASGVLPLDDEANKARFKHTMPNTGFSTAYPEGWQETGKMFRGLKAFKINALKELVSAQFNRHPVVVGRSGHSICYLRPMRKEKVLVDKYANSWKLSWGDQGFGYDSQGMMKSSSNGAWALVSITAPSFQL